MRSLYNHDPSYRPVPRGLLHLRPVGLASAGPVDQPGNKKPVDLHITALPLRHNHCGQFGQAQMCQTLWLTRVQESDPTVADSGVVLS